MPRLIWVFAGHTGHFVGFVMRWLILLVQFQREVFSWHGLIEKILRFTLQDGNTFCTTLQPRLFTIDLSIGEHSVYFSEVRIYNNWAASWQNQQNECAPSEDSDQPGHLPSLIRVFAVCMKKAWVLRYPLSTQRRLIRLGRCPGWSESSLGAQSLCWFCHEAAQMFLTHSVMYWPCWNTNNMYICRPSLPSQQSINMTKINQSLIR